MNNKKTNFEKIALLNHAYVNKTLYVTFQSITFEIAKKAAEFLRENKLAVEAKIVIMDRDNDKQYTF